MLIAVGLNVAWGAASAPAGFTFTGLGMLPGRIQSTANGISGDGSTVVGSSGTDVGSGGVSHAYYWTLETGMVGLGPPMTRA